MSVIISMHKPVISEGFSVQQSRYNKGRLLLIRLGKSLFFYFLVLLHVFPEVA